MRNVHDTILNVKGRTQYLCIGLFVWFAHVCLCKRAYMWLGCIKKRLKENVDSSYFLRRECTGDFYILL